MAEILPFRGIVYNQKKIPDLSLVVAPPYDTITPEDQETYYQRHDCNIIRLELGKDLPGDTEAENRYTRAAAYLRQWVEKGILVQEEFPCLYPLDIAYSSSPESTTKTVSGFLALLRLEDMNSKVVLPHEETFSGPKEDRLRLLSACEAHFSPIFALYSDPEDRIGHLVREGRNRSPSAHFLDKEGTGHRLWVLSASDIIGAISQDMQKKTLLLADGHHRYETALQYRTLRQEKEGGAQGQGQGQGQGNVPRGYDSVMVFFARMQDPGLTVLPYHRVVSPVRPFNSEDLLQKMRQFFSLTLMTEDGSEDDIQRKLWDAMQARGKERPVFGMYLRGRKRYYLLSLKPGGGVSEKAMDVSLFQTMILQTVVGLTDRQRTTNHHIVYTKDKEKAIQMVAAHEGEVAFFLNPPRMDEIMKVAERGERLPPKSTYFSPKPLTGLVINRMSS